MKKRTAKRGSTSKSAIRPPVLVQFGNRLRELRKEKGHTSQEIFAYEHGFNRVRYNKWEKGEDIKLTNLSRICDALGITLEDFFSKGFKK